MTTDKTHRRKGTGTIFLTSGGIYYGKIMVGGKIIQRKLTANKRESEKLWQEWLDENRPRKVDKSVLHPIGDIWPTVRDGMTAKQLQASIPKYKSEWRKFVDHFGAKTPLESLTRGQIVEYVSQRTEGKSIGRQNAIVAILRRFYDEILPDLKRSENPMSSFTTVKDETVSRQPFTDEELKRILDSAKDAGPEWELLFYVGLYTGLRFTDCAHLHTSQIKDGIIHVTPKKTLHRTATAVQIPIHHLLREKLEAMRVSEGYYMPSIVKMVDDKSKRSLAGYYTRRIFEKAGIETAVEVIGRSKKTSVKSFHALRATFISRLAQSGVGMGIIRNIAGHVGESQTQAYVHPDKETKEAAVDVLPDFTIGEKAGTFVDPAIQKVLDEAKRQIAEILEQKLGRSPDVEITMHSKLLNFAMANHREGETFEQTLDRVGLKWRQFKEK